MTKRPLMGTDNILELQENGYKSTVSAISEIIDNSIQANASNVDVIIIKNTTRDYNEIDEILIVDNGEGMNEEVFNKALQMSSGTRSKAKNGLGKYGQGLPNSSISQTKRVEVYTTQKNKTLYNYIDLQEIHQTGEAFLPEIENVNSIEIPIIQAKKVSIPKKGTIVRWVKPNRVKPKTAKTLSEHVEKVAGRTFRYYLQGFTDGDGFYYKTKINIFVFDYNGNNYEPNKFLSKKSIKPFDPMFLMEGTQTEELFPESVHPTSQRFEEECKEIFKIRYNGDTIETEVELKFSFCKKEERNRYGNPPGQKPFGKLYLKRNLLGTSGYNNISVIRAGREIDSGNFGFIGDVSDPTHRWWSAEIIVSPVLDSIIGVDNKKQQASHIRFLDKDEEYDEDTNEIIRWISKYLDENISTIKKEIDKQNVGRDSTPETKGPGLPPGSETEHGTDPDPDGESTDDEKVEIKKEFSKWIKERYPLLEDKAISKIVDYSLSIRDYHIFIKSDLGDTQLYSYNVFGKKVLIEINYTHSFYKRFVHQFEEDPTQEKSLRSIRLLIGSLVNAEIENKTKDKALLKDRRKIRNRMAESLDDYIEDLYEGR
ncbi:ATP-binding protein [Maribellus mangrovi]|uniref:ATP-binding protein n=1 Tax=Maribellus mangrovi TaxID=3133146 RepID=UPI0030EDD59C